MTTLGIFCAAFCGGGLFAAGTTLLSQAADFTFKDFAQGSAAVLMAGVLFYVVRVLAQTHKEGAERTAAATKDSADRAAAQERDCGARTEKTVATVDAICDRFSETSIATSKQFAEAHADTVQKFNETVVKLHEMITQRKTG